MSGAGASDDPALHPEERLARAEQAMADAQRNLDNAAQRQFAAQQSQAPAPLGPASFEAAAAHADAQTEAAAASVARLAHLVRQHGSYNVAAASGTQLPPAAADPAAAAAAVAALSAEARAHYDSMTAVVARATEMYMDATALRWQQQPGSAYTPGAYWSDGMREALAECRWGASGDLQQILDEEAASIAAAAAAGASLTAAAADDDG